MPTKSCNQHEPLHQLYGHSDCCLCRVERERDALRKQLDDALEAIELLESLVCIESEEDGELMDRAHELISKSKRP